MLMNISNERQDALRQTRIRTNVLAYLAGNNAAFNNIHSYLDSIVRSLVYSRRYSENIADDLKQECWVEILEKLHRWDPERGSLKTFLYKCLSNRIASYFRRNKSDNQCLLVEDIEPYIEHERKPTVPIEQNLSIKVCTRFNGALAVYIIRRIGVALYLRSFDRNRKQIVDDLRKISGRSFKEIDFLVDYALVVLRKNFVEA